MKVLRLTLNLLCIQGRPLTCCPPTPILPSFFSLFLVPALLSSSPVLPLPVLTDDDFISIFCLKNKSKHLSIGVSLPSLLTVAFMSSLLYYSLLQIETHEIGFLSWELSLSSLGMFMYLRRIPCFHRCFI